MFIMVVFILTN